MLLRDVRVSEGQLVSLGIYNSKNFTFTLFLILKTECGVVRNFWFGREWTGCCATPNSRSLVSKVFRKFAFTSSCLVDETTLGRNVLSNVTNQKNNYFMFLSFIGFTDHSRRSVYEINI